MKTLLTLLFALVFTLGLQAGVYADSHEGGSKTMETDKAKGDEKDKKGDKKKKKAEEEPDCA